LLNINISLEIAKFIVNYMIEISLYYIEEVKTNRNEIEEAILVDDLQNKYPNDKKFNIYEEEENKDLMKEDKHREKKKEL